MGDMKQTREFHGVSAIDTDIATMTPFEVVEFKWKEVSNQCIRYEASVFHLYDSGQVNIGHKFKSPGTSKLSGNSFCF